MSETDQGVLYEYKEQVKLSATGLVNEAGKFEVLAITAGNGNGWEFSEECLRASLGLWQGVECFVDHGGWFGQRSVRDLGGVCSNARWSEDDRGIKLDLETMGPSGPLVEELGRQLLMDKETKPRIGFSADVMFTAKGEEVKDILRVLDLSLVFNPARGGAFVRALNQLNPNHEMEVTMTDTITNATSSTVADQLQEDTAAIKDLQAAQQHQEKLAAEAEEARQVRIQMCAYLLESGLNASQLPEPMRQHVRKQFEGTVFTPDELNASIEDARSLVSEIQGSGTVKGPRISGMYNTEDQLQAAVDDLLGAPHDPGSEDLHPAKLSGIKELYMMMTGDRNLYGGYYPDRIQLATTSNFTGLVANSLNKIVADTWAQLGRAGYDWWERITVQEHFETLNTVTGVLVGTVGTLPSVSEGAEYTELKVGDSPETQDFTKYGT